MLKVEGIGQSVYLLHVYPVNGCVRIVCPAYN